MPQLFFRYLMAIVLMLLLLIIGSNTIGQAIDSPILSYTGYTSQNRDILLTDSRTRITMNLTRTSADEYYFAWSHDGEQLLYMATSEENRGDNLYIQNFHDGSLIDLTDEFLTAPFSPVWSPDGQSFAYFSSYPRNVSDVYIYNFDQGIRNLTNTPTQNEHSPQWSPDGTALVFSRERDIYIQQLDSDEATAISISRDVEAIPQWLRTNRMIYYRSTFTYSLLTIYDFETDEERELDFGSNVKQYTPAISPDERYVAMSNNRNHIVIVDVIEQQVVNTLEERDRLLTTAWSPDGRYIAFNEGSQTVSLWALDTDRVYSLNLGIRAAHQPLAWKP